MGLDFGILLEIFQYPFMQRALIAGVFLGAVFAYLGIFVVLRKMAFVSDGIAHASLAGVAVGVLVSLNPLLVALGLAVVVAVLIYWMEKHTNLSTDAIIGILFTSAMSLGVILMSLKAGYQPELVSFLFGNILSINIRELVFIGFLSLMIFMFVFIDRRRLLLISLDKDIAYVAGIKVNLYQLTLYILLSIAIVLGIKILGIILVSALLIIPPSTAKVVAKSFKSLSILSIIVSEAAVILGLSLSYYLNIPAGATIVMTGAVIFFAVNLFGLFKRA